MSRLPKTKLYTLIKSGQYPEAITLLSQYVAEPTPITDPAMAFQLLKPYCTLPTEHFFVITLDSAHHPIKVHDISSGILNRTLVHPREVFRPALSDNAAAIIISHNHPSGGLEPSNDDCDITDRLKEASEIIGIPILDHLIISAPKGLPTFVSLADINRF